MEDLINQFKIRRNGEQYNLADVIKATHNKISKKKGEYYINKDLVQQFLVQCTQTSKKQSEKNVPDHRKGQMTGGQLLQLEKIELEKMRISIDLENFRLQQLLEENHHKTKQMELEFQMKKLDYQLEMNKLDYQLEMNKLEIKMVEMGIVEIDDESDQMEILPQLIIEFDTNDESDEGVLQVEEEWMKNYGDEDDEELVDPSVKKAKKIIRKRSGKKK